MLKILEEEQTPEQWKVARIFFLFKKGEKKKQKITALCSKCMKNFCYRFEEFQEKKTHHTGSFQHCFKEKLQYRNSLP